jgi:catalase
LYVQVMEPHEVKDAPIDIFDNTFTWPHKKYPLRPLGRLTLNKNVSQAVVVNPSS